MKKLIKSLALVAFVSTATYSNGGVPVFDSASVAQAIQQVVHMKSQIDNQISQIKQMEANYKAVTGSRNIGQLFNNPALRSYLPANYASLYDAVKSGNNAQLSRALDELAKKEKGYSLEKNGKERYNTQQLMNKATSIQALEAQNLRLDNIQNLMNQINLATDPKAAQDLSNRLAVEQATIQAEQTRINLMMQLNRANLELAKEQRDTESVNSLIGR